MKKVILTGSSIFEGWTKAPRCMPELRVINRAIGGTITQDWAERFADILAEELPDAVLFYCGSNDLNNKVPTKQILANVAQCRQIIHRESPNSRFAYFGIIKAPQKADKWDLVDQLNATIRSQLHNHDLYIETNTVFFPHDAPVARFLSKINYT